MLHLPAGEGWGGGSLRKQRKPDFGLYLIFNNCQFDKRLFHDDIFLLANRLAETAMLMSIIRSNCASLWTYHDIPPV